MPTPESLLEGGTLRDEEFIIRHVFGGKIHPKKFAELRRQGLVPYIKIGHRSYLYDEAAVRRALRRLRIGEGK